MMNDNCNRRTLHKIILDPPLDYIFGLYSVNVLYYVYHLKNYFEE